MFSLKTSRVQCSSAREFNRTIEMNKMPLNLHDTMSENDVDVTIVDLLTNLIEILLDFMLHGFGILVVLIVTTVLAYKCSMFCLKLLWNTLLILLRENLPMEPRRRNPSKVIGAKKVIHFSTITIEVCQTDVICSCSCFSRL